MGTNLASQLAQQLEQLRHQNVSQGNPAPVQQATSQGTAHIDLIAVESLSCAFLQLRLVSDRLADVSGEQLHQLGEALASRINYLLEPIVLVECDPQQGHVQLRSQPPHVQQQQRAYYELLARRGGEIRLTRYQKSPGQPRQPAAAVVTREVLARLVNDLDQTLAEAF